ncbi:MAG: Rrf2 family transcriptional regulator [Lachnospiraceae bacterium]|nr:Rrf2 family transcriptional regulator [Lachnospiraceae bacterium]
MKLSTKGRYGLRAMVDLADHGEIAPVSISAISARQDISVSYLEQLLAKLRKAGLVKSVRGAQGGYILERDAREISVGEILRVLEGDLTPVNCAELTQDEKSCSGSQYCVTKYVWQRINDSIQDTVNNIWLSELVEDSRKIEHKPFVRECEN